MTPLCEIGLRWGTDKVGSHDYTSVYYRLLADRRKTIERVLEVGIGHPGLMGVGYRTGASLFMWQEFFPNAQVYAFDINPVSMVNMDRVHSFVADQGDAESLQQAVRQTGGWAFDLIVDDGSHVLSHQIITMCALLPFLASGGIYIIEDIIGPDGASTGDTTSITGQLPPGYVATVEYCPSRRSREERILVIRRA